MERLGQRVSKAAGCRAILFMSDSPANIASLYSSERHRLGRLIRRMVDNASTADELVHDAFSHLISAAGHRPIEHPKAYLTQAARNLALNHLRHLRQGVEVSVDEQIYEAVADRRASPEMETLYRQEMRRLLAALESLPPRRREIFILHRFEELTYDQIAARLTISRNTVMVQIVNALADLDRLLGRNFLRSP
jgi:RNA polymerase sigma-70 factor (ECF subfamily)